MDWRDSGAIKGREDFRNSVLTRIGCDQRISGGNNRIGTTEAIRERVLASTWVTLGKCLDGCRGCGSAALC